MVASASAKIPGDKSDEESVGSFSDNAANIFQAAESAMQAGQQPTEMTIVIGQEGGIHLIAESDWPLERLLHHHGAQMAYRVRQLDKLIRLEGRAGPRTCVFEAPKLGAAVRALLADHAQYELTQGSGDFQADLAALFLPPSVEEPSAEK